MFIMWMLNLCDLLETRAIEEMQKNINIEQQLQLQQQSKKHINKTRFKLWYEKGKEIWFNWIYTVLLNDKNVTRSGGEWIKSKHSNRKPQANKTTIRLI